MRGFCNDVEFSSSRGHPTFDRDPSVLRKPLEVLKGLYAESNLSANGIRDVLVKVLGACDIPSEELRVYLRQDRDAASSSASS